MPIKDVRLYLSHNLRVFLNEYYFSVCPSGFTYLGDDETEDGPLSRSKRYWLEEIDRSPTYSCYKIQKAGNGLNEAWNKCEQLEGHLLALNNDGEAWLRLASQFLKNFNHNKTYLTSGFYFKDVEKWMWFGTSKEQGFWYKTFSEIDVYFLYPFFQTTL